MSQAESPKRLVEEVALPPEPSRPSAADCCGNGCSVCVLDLYEIQLKAWKEKCADLLSGKRLIDSKSDNDLSATDFVSFEVIFINELYEDTMIVLINLSSLNRPRHCAWHVVARLWSTDGRQLSRSYTPMIPSAVSEILQSRVDFMKTDRDYIALLIKLYPDGKFSNLLRNVKVGDMMDVLGPVISYQYTPNKFETILFLAGGTGVLPFIQLLEHILEDNEVEETSTRLLYSSRCYAQIHCHDLLHGWTRFWNFSLKHFISQEPNKELVTLKWGENVEWCRLEKSHLLEETRTINPLKDAIFLCGPPEFERCIFQYLTRLKINSCVIRLS